MRKHFYGLVLGLALPIACGGASGNFDDRDTGDAGEPGTGGSAGGSGGTQGGGPSGGSGGTAPVGGSSGTANGGTGFGGTDSGGTSAGGQAGEGAVGGSGGSAGAAVGGSAGVATGGTGGAMGGSAGAGGMPDPRCPIRPPTGTCEGEDLSCRYDLARMCLCVTVVPPGYCGGIDPRCTAMARIAPPQDGGGAAIPVSTSTCDCNSGTWFCHIP
jgi:hypothetical protein